MVSQLISNLTKDGNDGPYKTDPSSWYKSYPYGFSFWEKKSLGLVATQNFWLPIAPSNINITTHFATNIITTLYGVVEEHSEVRYYDITISGNTGIAPRYTTPFNVSLTDKPVAKAMPGVGFANPTSPGSPSVGRSSFGSSDTSALSGFLPEVANALSSGINLINETGIRPEQSGYYAFHNFYKFLLRYKQDAAGVFDNAIEVGLVGPKAANTSNLRKNHPLQFLNYKDSVKYDVIPISFTLTRSAEHPMLYNYSIKLRGFNLQNVSAKEGDAENLLNDLGLGSLKGSLFSKITSKVGNASTLISDVAGAP